MHMDFKTDLLYFILHGHTLGYLKGILHLVSKVTKYKYTGFYKYNYPML